MTRGSRPAAVAAVAAVAALLAACGGSAGPAATLSASHVDVRVSVAGAGDDRVLEARFTPDAPGLHLYGPDLPTGGVDGAGRPTSVEVVGGGWVPAGSGVEVAPTPFPTALPGFSAPFSVEPDGPVTLRIPIRPGAGDRSTVSVAVTYMACTSDGRCYPPVVGERLEVPVP